MAGRTNHSLFRSMETSRSVAAWFSIPSKMELPQRLAYCGKLLWASLRMHAFMAEAARETVYQTKAYQTTVMQHVVENLLSLCRFDNLKTKTQDYENRLNRLEQHCKIGRSKVKGSWALL